jgi:hypothetical protein
LTLGNGYFRMWVAGLQSRLSLKLIAIIVTTQNMAG